MNKDTVLITGNFNVLHPGHVRLFKFAKKFGKHLIVGIFSDQLAAGLVDVEQELRKEAVEAIDLVDEAIIIEKSLEDFLEIQKPEFVAKGKEHEFFENPEYDILNRYGGKLIFSSGEIGLLSDSSNKSEFDIPTSTKLKIRSFMDRHNISNERLIEIINEFSSKKVCVIGDLIIDEYIDCFPLGMSQEEATLVVTPQQKKKFLGGAGIVASHASRLGSSVNFISVVGKDKERDYAATALEKYDVNYSFVVDNARPTTLKQRFRSDGRSLLRVSTLSQQAMSSNLQKIVFAEFEKCLTESDVLIFSDFNYGALPQPLVEKMIKRAKQHKIFISADSQSSSQFGDVSRFKGANLITPTEREARLSLQNYDDGLVVLANKLMGKTKSEFILLKLGSEGMIAQHPQTNINSAPNTERLVALNSKAIDVSGAGDSVLTTASLALSTGASLWEASLLGSISAFIQVGRIGNIPVTKNEILQLLS